MKNSSEQLRNNIKPDPLNISEMDSSFSPIDRIGEEIQSALKTGYTYNPLKNPFLAAGFLWGLPVPVLALVLTVSFKFNGWADVTVGRALITALQTPLLYIFYTCPILSGFLFGIFGTILKHKKEGVEKQHKQLQTLAIQDPLTGLYNHRYIWIRLNEEIEHAKREDDSVSVLMCDLDGFKKINDRLGHNMGDLFLKKTARLFKTLARSYDVVARYGGDEFFFILPGTEVETAREVADRVGTEFHKHQPLLEDHPDLTVGVSIGIASYPEESLTPKGIVQMADRRMYKMKNKNSDSRKEVTDTDRFRIAPKT